MSERCDNYSCKCVLEEGHVGGCECLHESYCDSCDTLRAALERAERERDVERDEVRDAHDRIAELTRQRDDAMEALVPFATGAAVEFRTEGFVAVQVEQSDFDRAAAIVAREAK